MCYRRKLLTLQSVESLIIFLDFMDVLVDNADEGSQLYEKAKITCNKLFGTEGTSKRSILVALSAMLNLHSVRCFQDTIELLEMFYDVQIVITTFMWRHFSCVETRDIFTLNGFDFSKNVVGVLYHDVQFPSVENPIDTWLNRFSNVPRYKTITIGKNITNSCGNSVQCSVFEEKTGCAVIDIASRQKPIVKSKKRRLFQ
jgi:hypothetical protein